MINVVSSALDRLAAYCAIKADIERISAASGETKARYAVGDYKMWFNHWINQVRTGAATPEEFHTRHRQVIQFLAEQAYVDGMARGGMFEPLDSSDLLRVAAWTSEQLRHTWSFAEALQAALDSGDWRDVERRQQMWVDAIYTLEGMGYAEARGNVMVTWVLGETEDHCYTCAWLNGQRHRLRWFISRGYIPRQNGSSTLECEGWQCRCSLVDDNGARILPK